MRKVTKHLFAAEVTNKAIGWNYSELRKRGKGVADSVSI